MKLGHSTITVFAALLGLSLTSSGQTSSPNIELPTLSEEATISLLTVAPGEAIHSIFGHCS